MIFEPFYIIVDRRSFSKVIKTLFQSSGPLLNTQHQFAARRHQVPAIKLLSFKFFQEFLKFRCNDHRTERILRMIIEIIMMIVFSQPKR
ncbi:MAG: hypothetical protein K0R59_2890 [Sphingobacterium sp.]|nr:hypothetical protein [Sphingobacterium sp.]